MASVTSNNNPSAIHTFKRFMDEERIRLKMHKLLKEKTMDKPISQKHLKQQQKNLQDKHPHLS